ncbi:MAG: hypothetical protein GXX99_07965 [Clostridiales bacterium]|nr:hypothetical protein [Clostridiales bacterium]
MERIEMVESLRNRANVSYEEAKQALERCNWDLLDALVMLEGQGRVKEPSAASYSTQAQQAEQGPAPVQRGSIGRGIHRLMRALDVLIEKSLKNSVELQRDGKRILGMPVLLALVLTLCFFWVTVPLLIISIACGYRLCFIGPVGREANVVMDKVTQKVEEIKQEMTRDE